MKAEIDAAEIFSDKAEKIAPMNLAEHAAIDSKKTEPEKTEPEKTGATTAETKAAAAKKHQPIQGQDLLKRARRRNRRRGFKPKRRGRPSRMSAGGSR